MQFAGRFIGNNRTGEVFAVVQGRNRIRRIEEAIKLGHLDTWDLTEEWFSSLEAEEEKTG